MQIIITIGLLILAVAASLLPVWIACQVTRIKLRSRPGSATVISTDGATRR